LQPPPTADSVAPVAEAPANGDSVPVNGEAKNGDHKNGDGKARLGKKRLTDDGERLF
jgi:hypothetical protein